MTCSVTRSSSPSSSSSSTVGSVLGALSTSLPVFIIARVLQGFAAAVIPLAIGLLRTNLQPQRVHSGIGIVSATLGAGNGVGLLLAGVISALIPGYAPLFWIITALSVLALILALTCIPSTDVRRPGPLIFLARSYSAARSWLSCSPSVKALTGAGGQHDPRHVRCRYRPRNSLGYCRTSCQ